MTTDAKRLVSMTPFVHQAFFYGNDDDYLAGTVPFIEEGLAAGEPVLVAVPMPRLEMLRSHFARTASARLQFSAMDQMGRNPAWIIPAWADFVQTNAAPGRPARGIGEPIWLGRTDEELVECGRHEALLNLAFANALGFTLLCPYDVSSLDARVIEEAHRNHPHVSGPGVRHASGSYDGGIPAWLETPLPPVPMGVEAVTFDRGSLAWVRNRAVEAAAAGGVGPERLGDVALAVSEAITNSVCHGGGFGEVSLWSDNRTFYCEICDRGRISDPLAGRVKPSAKSPAGRGLWLMNQLCDLVQIRATPGGQLIRLQFGI
ncbi:MAG: hypothetical protein QOJ19_3658 [Acidimicrobiia bacterium]|nr:hypothetical protein [Acidimicrobiia bacterium]